MTSWQLPMNKIRRYPYGIVNLADINLWDEDVDKEIERRRRDGEGERNYQDWVRREVCKDD